MASRPRNARDRRGSRDHRNARDRRTGRASSFSDTVSTQFGALSEVMGSARLAFVMALFGIIVVVFFARLFYLQVIVSDHYAAMASESRTVSFDTTPRRGTIYDRNGVVLATSVDATTIYANPAEVTDASYEANKIASVLGGEVADYKEALSTAGTSFVYVKRQADVDKAEQLRALELDGIYFIDDTRREYPNGAVGGQVIGICNVDGEGITGLELQYDDILRGTPGTYEAERGRKGTPIPGGVKEQTRAVDGQDIMVSLDIKLQHVVEDALKAGVEDPAIAGEKGNSVVMDAATGEIYAICSLPYLDPTNLEESDVGSENLTAITQAFEPGSIFKTVSALTVLESGAMTAEDMLFCPSFIQADEYEISDAHARGDVTMTLREILNKSSNVGISLAINKVGFEKLHDAIVRFGLNEATGVDYPGEASGLMQDFDEWARITGYNVSFGQGLTCSPLQMTRFYGAIANDGVAVTPHFLISYPQTGEVPEYETKRVVDNEGALEQIKSMLRTVVQEGTGTAADIEGFDVVGKTSTAEIAGDGGYVAGKYNLCFTGFIDNSSSQLVCFVSANEVYSEASVASTFKDIMANAIEQYNIVPEV
ncbi:MULTISPECIES: penicillin-binding protein 2 [unclassified Adlercreutzia]|uniref:peptidoglycan D,D-transpeptidase FtsI family protein n=1 Tax=unclassified Adlercreutzia TaxID=2636013 RepID=UPI001F15464E|nr:MULTISPECIES: penicillin-binding protein 2 [unclassified Adlercreutzia]